MWSPAAPVQAEVGKTVLVVDDEPTVRMLVVDALGERGFACLEAADGSAGLKTLQSEVRIDLLITDIGLPGGMNGRQVADAARALRPDLKVLFLTGYAYDAAMDKEVLGSNTQLLGKPVAMEVFCAKVDGMLQSS